MKIIVTTTINSPTEAIEKFDALKDWHLIVIGDKKTPEYKLKRGRYVSPDEQTDYDEWLSETIGWNCIQRRNIGFLMAYDMGAEIVASIDDDNIPMDGWGENVLHETESNYYQTYLPCFDPVKATNVNSIWHRGYPLQLVSKRDYSVITKTVKCDIQADFWNETPDIDAICRLQNDRDFYFLDEFFPIASNKISPFNSQNTFLSRKVLKDYFMFPGVGRMDDIWASFHCQAQGHTVMYGKPSVTHKRNEHNIIEDMKAEYLGYENNLKIVTELQTNKDAVLNYIPERSRLAFKLYQRHFK